MPRPTGPQFIRAFHTSWKETPPHELEHKAYTYTGDDSNEHPDIIHMGTRAAALHKYRPFMHEYEIDTSAVEPVVYSDEPHLVNRTDYSKNPHDSTANDWKRAMAGKQEGLWETVTPNVGEAAAKGKIVPYRNRAEDAGSVSYAVSRSAIKSGKVRHVGVVNLDTERDRLKREEGMK